MNCRHEDLVLDHGARVWKCNHCSEEVSLEVAKSDRSDGAHAERAHCVTCDCFKPAVVGWGTGSITLTNGCALPVCDRCGGALIWGEIYTNGEQKYHSTCARFI